VLLHHPHGCPVVQRVSGIQADLMEKYVVKSLGSFLSSFMQEIDLGLGFYMCNII